MRTALWYCRMVLPMLREGTCTTLDDAAAAPWCACLSPGCHLTDNCCSLLAPPSYPADQQVTSLRHSCNRQGRHRAAAVRLAARSWTPPASSP